MIWKMQEEGKEGKEAMDERLREVGSNTMSRLDAAINDPEVAKAMAQSAALQRIEELKARARAPPKPRAKSIEADEVGASFMQQTSANAGRAQAAVDKIEVVKQEKRVKSFEGLEIDPRGFIVPQVGDIVLCPGKWANEDMVALVEATQFVDSRMSWNVDVIELSQVGADLYGKQYSAWKPPIKRWYDVSEIRPARVLEYVEDQDAWKVENAKNYINTPILVNETARDLGLEEYGVLKTKILTNTAIIGLAGSGALALYDTSFASSFALGALSSIGYIALLAGSVEQVKPGGAQSAGPPLLSLRFLAPLALFAGIYIKFQYYSPYEDDGITSTGDLPSVPTGDIFAAAIGFLSYKVPLLYESTKEIAKTLDDAGEGLESGLGEGYKMWQVRIKDNVKEARMRESNPETAWNPFTQIRLRAERWYAEEAERKKNEEEAGDKKD